MKVAVVPGSFDPITVGHVDIIKRMAPLFDKVVIGIGNNTAKKYFFSIEQRVQWIEKIFADNDNIVVKTYDALTIDFCRANNANYILRGLRDTTDFNYEKSIAQLNNSMDKEIETIFTFTNPQFAHISSTIVREIIKYKGDVSEFIPAEIVDDITSSY